MKTREQHLIDVSSNIKALATELTRYTAENLTQKEYTAIVEIREACNRIIEDELSK